jgi:hypothetical protein
LQTWSGNRSLPQWLTSPARREPPTESSPFNDKQNCVAASVRTAAPTPSTASTLLNDDNNNRRIQADVRIAKYLLTRGSCFMGITAKSHVACDSCLKFHSHHFILSRRWKAPSFCPSPIVFRRWRHCRKH